MSRVIARGTLRVDARRAVAKLREHLLVDLHLYALEIVRAAVAGGATFVDAAYGADEVALTFDGEQPPAASLARLLDHVLDEAGAPGARPRRLLALGVNAALGLGPAHVELMVAGPPCTRVRWTPALLEAEALPSPETVPAPADLPPGATRVRVRRKLGWDVLRAAALGGTPREIDLLAEATAELPIPLTLAGATFTRAPRPAALVRVRFDVPGARRASLEIVASSGASTLDFLELGVLLIRAPLDFGPQLPRDLATSVDLPVRVSVDADALPTNASRSALREDAGLPRLVTGAALGALADGARALAVAAGIEQGEIPPGVQVFAKDPVVCEDALGLVACAAANAIALGAEVPAELRAVVDLPLFQNAVGRRVARGDVRPDGAGVIRVLRMPPREGPLPEELAPWLEHVVWLRGRAVERLLADSPTADAAPLVEQARVGLERRRRLLLRARGEPVLPAALDVPGSGALRTAFDVREGPFEGLRGEVTLAPEGVSRTRIHVHVEGRLLETVELDRNLVPLPIEVALSWEGHIVPRLSYDGVERDQAFVRAVHYAAVVETFALDREVGRATKARDEAALADLRPVVRAAIGTLVLGEERLGVTGVRQAPSLQAFPALLVARVWPTTEPGRFESVMSLGDFAWKHRALVTAKPGTRGRAVDGRPVIALDARELEWLARACRYTTALVPYGPWLIRPGEEAAHEALRNESLVHALGAGPRGPSLAFVRRGLRGLVAASAEPRVTLCHVGRVLDSNPVPAELGPITVVIDDDSLVPSPAADAPLAWSMQALADIEREHCERLCAAVEGDPEARARFGCGDAVATIPAVRDYLLDRAAYLRHHPADGPDPEGALRLLARLEDLALLTMLDERGAPVPTSLAAVRAAHPPPAPLPALRAPPGFETLDWRPLLVPDDAVLGALNRWRGGGAVRSEVALSHRLVLAMADRDRRAFLSGPELDPRALGDLAPPSAASFFLDRDAPGGMTVAVGIPRVSFGNSYAWVDVLFRGRALCRRPLAALPVPVVARVGVTDEAHVAAFRDLSEEGVAQVIERVHAAAVAFALDLVQRASGPGRGGALFGDLGALRLLLALLVEDDRSPAGIALMLRIWLGSSQDAGVLIGGLAGALRSSGVFWPTVQGEEHPFDALQTGGGAVYVGRARYASWRTAEHPTELDAPILYLAPGPEGDTLQAIVESFVKKGTRDVSAALEALQRRRAASEPLPIPRLPGAPLHPDLRIGLAELGARYGEGELEITEGPASDITLIDLMGTPRSVKAELPFPVRAVVRIDAVDTGTAGDRVVVQKIARSAGKHLLTLAPRAAALPEIVRADLRKVLVKPLEKGKKVGVRVEHAKIFADVSGALRSYAELRERKTGNWECTNDPPPHPSGPLRAAVLILSSTETSVLSASVPLKNVTSNMRRELEGQRRARAPQVASLALDTAVRARCLSVARVDEEGVTGEVGLLAPEHHGSRGLAIFVGRRPLCTLRDGTGWPIVALLNDDAAPPNLAFDGLRTGAAGVKLQRVARAAALRALQAIITPPPDALGVRWLAGGERGVEGITVAGALWLPRAWPREPPVVRVRVPGSGALYVRRSLVAAEAPAFLLGDVPVAGELLATGDGPWSGVATLALRAAFSMLAAAKNASPTARDAYRWDLRLFGYKDEEEPRAPTADGKTVTGEDVLAELAARGAVWVSERRGDADGDFPEGAPAFVLLAHPDAASAEVSPLVEVLRRRAAPGVLRTLGGPASEAAVAETAALVKTAAPPIVPADAPSRDAPAEPAAEPSWLSGLWGAVRSFFGRDDILGETPLTAAVEEVLDALELTGDPVVAVFEVRSGRPVRYEPGMRRVLVNRQHRALAWLGRERAVDERAVALLAAAAVCEINRLLVEVTDQDERAALGALLERAASRIRGADR